MWSNAQTDYEREKVESLLLRICEQTGTPSREVLVKCLERMDARIIPTPRGGVRLTIGDTHTSITSPSYATWEKDAIMDAYRRNKNVLQAFLDFFPLRMILGEVQRHGRLQNLSQEINLFAEGVIQ